MSNGSLGERIKNERLRKGVSLREFARQIKIAPAYLVDIEKNRRNPGSELLSQIADLLGIPISSLDEFLEVPKQVRDWISETPGAEETIRTFKESSSPSPLRPKSRRFALPIAIYESELQAIGAESSAWTRETGGDLFGVWDDIPIIYLATRAGPEAVRDATHFRLDVNYLKSLSVELQRDWSLTYFGDWHSHHKLGLASPSGGDRRRIQRLADKNNFATMAEFIVTFGDTFDIDKKINVHPHVYMDLPSDIPSPTALIVLKGISPVREALIQSSRFPEQQLDAFSSFAADKVTIPSEPLGRAPGADGASVQRISDRIFERTPEILGQIVQSKIEMHTTQFGRVVVVPVSEHQGVAFAIDQKWPHKALQVNWIDRASGNTDEMDFDLSIVSLLNLQSIVDLVSAAKKQKGMLGQ